MINTKIYLDSPLAKYPTRGSIGAAGWDLYAALEEPVAIWPGKTVFIDTGLIVEIPYGYFGAIYPRSGLACKYGLRLANCTAVIDSDYRGHVKIALHNDGTTEYYIAPGERIAQMIIQPYDANSFEVIEKKEDLTDTVRSTNGFGSTGSN